MTVKAGDSGGGGVACEGEGEGEGSEQEDMDVGGVEAGVGGALDEWHAAHAHPPP